ncbi:4-hydroxybenzoate polyprenyltransferase [Chitinivorax tropicus]|uniref:4-hydroxybenzoate octaprenyltransferase n=1 Tax=Chitinivorax tropicus TaxID=714531 RepID=A0A840MGT1_9PROT|nr:4-hydroxybenzoate octaprenyltransferase [Chitinivorax tropicus]MBB5017858.1 4-hydroxybenzoate polyprenyltransferase [Chitinivorax tropicus]
MNWTQLKQRLDDYEKLMRLDKPIGILLLLWPTLWGLWIAAYGTPGWMLIWIFVFGTVLMRSAGCVINDYADRDIDPHVARTKQRPLAARRVTTKETLLLAGTLSICAFLLIWPLNALTKWLSVPALLLAASYPFTKRFLAIPQAYLGIAFSFGIPMTFAAAQDRVPLLAWMLVLVNIFWVIAYDTAYAMVDREDDLKIGIKTSAITFGNKDVAAIVICHLLFLAGMAVIGHLIRMSWVYYTCLGLALALVGYQYYLIKDRIPERCFRAFLDNNWIGLTIFVGTFLHYLLINKRFW